jgi:GT2 family glycosyltransferase
VNGGFSYGNNFAIRPSLRSFRPPAYIWLLNPDTVARPGMLRTMIDFMNAHPRAGIAGSGIEEENGVLWPYAFRFPSVWSELDNGLRLGVVTRLLAGRIVRWRMSDQPAAVDWVPGASMIVRREVFESVGLMDEGYFLYFEETDFCRQARIAGWECWYVPGSRIMHIAGQSTGISSSMTTPKRRPKYWFDSRRRYFAKNHGRCYAMAADLVWMASYLVRRLLRLLRPAPDTDPPRMFLDFLRNSSLLNLRVPASTAAGAPSTAPAAGER